MIWSFESKSEVSMDERLTGGGADKLSQRIEKNLHKNLPEKMEMYYSNKIAAP